ncbi:MAG: D-glycero-beta-D-manno-heptose 1-phosphate adenylyltransferase [Longimicrobiales bacterium]
MRLPSSKILTHEEAVERYGPGRSLRLVFTNGCFDLLHAGHVELLAEARALGDALVVGLNTDASVRRLGKGSSRPLVDQSARAEVVAALEAVDGVTLFDEDTPAELVDALLPDVIVKGGDYSVGEVVGGETVRARGGRVVIVPLKRGYSTTDLLAKIRKDEAQG